MLLNDNNNLIKKVTFFYDSKNTNMAGPPSSQSELSYEHTYCYHIGTSLTSNITFEPLSNRRKIADLREAYKQICGNNTTNSSLV